MRIKQLFSSLGLLAIVIFTSQTIAVAQQDTASWPHLTPQGFGLHIASGDVQHAPWKYKPRNVPDATAYLQVPFLPVSRRGERIDVYVPAATKSEDRLPCIVLYYGGGWGGKYTSGLREITQDLVARGYVVALPDYVLKAQEPVPTAIWDGAHAIRWLRDNAARYNIDTTRIGVWGFSAGGWLVQYMTPSSSSTLYSVTPKENDRRGERILVPMLDPHPTIDQPLAVQAVVSDWGCGKYTDARVTDHGNNWLGANDPPVFTCHNVKSVVPPGSRAYRDAGAFIELCHLETKSTHVPKGSTPGIDATGKPTTWFEAVYDFLDRHVKHPSQATAPEASPAGGSISAPTEVVLRSVYADRAAIHFTTDGSDPTRQSPIYRGPLTIAPGQSLRAIVIATDLKPSEVASFEFRKATVSQPTIQNVLPQYTAQVGKRFEVTLAADGGDISWNVVGRRGHVIDRKSSSREPQAWLRIDSSNGVLSGTPTAPGYNVVIVIARRGEGDEARIDARRVVVVVEK